TRGIGEVVVVARRRPRAVLESAPRGVIARSEFLTRTGLLRVVASREDRPRNPGDQCRSARRACGIASRDIPGPHQYRVRLTFGPDDCPDSGAGTVVHHPEVAGFAKGFAGRWAAVRLGWSGLGYEEIVHGGRLGS